MISLNEAMLESTSAEELIPLAQLSSSEGDLHQAITSLEVALMRGHSIPQLIHILLASEYFQLHTGGERRMPNSVIEEIRRYRKLLGVDHEYHAMEDGPAKVLEYIRYFNTKEYDYAPNIQKSILNISDSGIFLNPINEDAQRQANRILLYCLMEAPRLAEILPDLIPGFMAQRPFNGQ